MYISLQCSGYYATIGSWQLVIGASTKVTESSWEPADNITNDNYLHKIIRSHMFSAKSQPARLTMELGRHS